MKMYRSTLPLRICAASRTHAGSVVGLSMATSHCRFFSASNWPFRSPINCSTSFGNSPGCVFPRLNVVTLCPRISAYRTWYGPVKPVPPRMRMRRGFTDFSANSVADLVPKASAPPVTAESLINWRRVLFNCPLTFLVIPSEVEESLIENEETRSCETDRRNNRRIILANHCPGREPIIPDGYAHYSILRRKVAGDRPGNMECV